MPLTRAMQMLVDLCMRQPEGKYVLVRDPTRPVLRLYSVPPGTFESDDDEPRRRHGDFDEDEEGEEEGEDAGDAAQDDADDDDEEDVLAFKKRAK